MNLTNPKTQAVSAGVEDLISRLRDEGVEKGRSEADKILAKAKKEADAILVKARKEADAYYSKRQEEMESYEQALEEDLRNVFRDNLLKMQENLVTQFTQKIQRLISEATAEEDILERMILEIVGKERKSGKVDDAKNIEVLLPETVMGVDYLRQNPERVKEGRLSKFVMEKTAELLRDGVSISTANDIKGGIKVLLKDEKVTIDISEKALGDMVMKHLQPRFRAILEGVVK